ncbi:hypothetical protein [Parerythrobacter lacustris]|uniref:DUF4238 domain-containing protein n=1 Tax=Parerythrobacter lacustris TaxID=2969984 RepID=A0ABT1XPC1_9SPHN|nr:hypothetical protein [Parerythrobacter lacustris]MCR2833498.1 hypothetical protein [Parerythrobacter lacustris]
MPNALIIGSDKEPIFDHLPDRFLFIDDGTLIDRVELPPRRAVINFDPLKHSFNPLKGMSYQKARQFWDVLKSAFPEGENTLTKAAAELQILRALTDHPRSLSTLIPDTKDTQYAHQLIAKLLLSPVLERVLCRPTNLSFKGTILARLDRATLGDFDAFVIANLLISQYPGPVVLPDFGFYQCRFHSALLRQNRLIAGVNSFDEVPAWKQRLLLVDTKIPSHCTPDDAKLLAIYAGIPPGTNKYNTFIEESIT